MADKNIGALPAAESLNDDSLLIVEQSGEAAKLPGRVFRQFAESAAKSIAKGDKGDDGEDFKILGYYTDLTSLQSAVKSPSAGDAYGVGSAAPYDIYIWDGINSVWVNNGSIQGPEGPKGEKGDTGAQGPKGDTGVQGPKGDTGAKGDKGDAFVYADFTADQLAALTGPQGPVGPIGPKGDTGETGPQGPKGDTGDTGAQGIQGPKGDTGATGPTGAKGDTGSPGKDGATIVSIERTGGTGAPGTTDTYTIVMSDGTTGTFSVYNGADGEGAGDMTAAVYDPQGRKQDVFAYVDDAVAAIPTPDVSAQIQEHNESESAHADIRAAVSGKEDKANKVTELSGTSTDTEYPSAKAVYDALQGVSVTTDEAPTEGSTNPVQSGGVNDALGRKMDTDNPWCTGCFRLYATYAAGYEGYGEVSFTAGQHAAARGDYSQAMGYEVFANGNYSHAEGRGTEASTSCQHVQGRYNIRDENDDYAHIVGNGTMRKFSNAHTLDWSGNAWYAGDVYVGSTSGTNKDEGSKRLATVDEVTSLSQKLENIDASNVKFSDGTTFQDKLDSGELKGADGAKGDTGATGPAGATGAAGAAGKDATINGVNALTLEAGAGLSGSQDGSTYTLSLASHTQAASTITAGTFAGAVVAADDTNYTTYQVRNAAILSATPSSMTNGRIAFVYS